MWAIIGWARAIFSLQLLSLDSSVWGRLEAAIAPPFNSTEKLLAA